MKNKFLILMFLIGLIFYLFNSYFYGSVIIVSFFFGILFFKIIKRLQLPKYHYIIVYVALVLSIIGELGFYRMFEVYDKLLHLFVPFFLSLMVFDYLNKFEIEHKYFLVFFIVLGFGAFFEVFEYSSDMLLGLDMGGVTNLSGEILVDEWSDTIWDLIMTSIGSISFIIISYWRRKS